MITNLYNELLGSRYELVEDCGPCVRIRIILIVVKRIVKSILSYSVLKKIQKFLIIMQSWFKSLHNFNLCYRCTKIYKWSKITSILESLLTIRFWDHRVSLRFDRSEQTLRKRSCPLTDRVTSFLNPRRYPRRD